MSIITDTAISKILFDLLTISKYTKGNVIETTSEYLNIVESSIKVSTYRSLSGDTRVRALERIHNIIGIAYEYSERLLESRYLDLYKINARSGFISITPDDITKYNERYDLIVKIHDGLSGCISGLDEFKQNYDAKHDSNTVGNCEKLQTDTSKKVSRLKNKMNELTTIKFAFEEYRDGLEAL